MKLELTCMEMGERLIWLALNFTDRDVYVYVRTEAFTAAYSYIRRVSTQSAIRSHVLSRCFQTFSLPSTKVARGQIKTSRTRHRHHSAISWGLHVLGDAGMSGTTRSVQGGLRQ
jgi:hypothetical protein